jgi:hypothetical protein
MNFPADSIGNWQIYVMTEAEQVIGVLRFKVVDSPAQTGLPDAKIENTSSPASIKTESREMKTEPANQDETPNSAVETSITASSANDQP